MIQVYNVMQNNWSLISSVWEKTNSQNDIRDLISLEPRRNNEEKNVNSLARIFTLNVAKLFFEFLLVRIKDDGGAGDSKY